MKDTTTIDDFNKLAMAAIMKRMEELQDYPEDLVKELPVLIDCAQKVF